MNKTLSKEKVEENTKTKTQRYKNTKTRIPAAVRKIVWSTYMDSVKNSKCLCCSI